MKKNNLIEQYLIDVNSFDDVPKKKIRKLNNKLVKNVDILCIRLIGFSLGVITMKVIIEQLVMQLGVYFR